MLRDATFSKTSLSVATPKESEQNILSTTAIWAPGLLGVKTFGCRH